MNIFHCLCNWKRFIWFTLGLPEESFIINELTILIWEKKTLDWVCNTGSSEKVLHEGQNCLFCDDEILVTKNWLREVSMSADTVAASCKFLSETAEHRQVVPDSMILWVFEIKTSAANDTLFSSSKQLAVCYPNHAENSSHRVFLFCTIICILRTHFMLPFFMEPTGWSKWISLWNWLGSLFKRWWPRRCFAGQLQGFWRIFGFEISSRSPFFFFISSHTDTKGAFNGRITNFLNGAADSDKNISQT